MRYTCGAVVCAWQLLEEEFCDVFAHSVNVTAALVLFSGTLSVPAEEVPAPAGSPAGRHAH